MKLLLVLIPGLPAFASVILALVGKRLPYRVSSMFASLAVFGSLVCVLVLASTAPTLFPLADVRETVWQWIAGRSLDIPFRFRFDNLTLCMTLLVSGFGFLIVVYSGQYMEHDDEPSRYFSAITLFVSSMLLLVLADNLIVLYMGWEGVGLCSYLLIGHYWRQTGTPDAAAKAIIINRVGDLFFLFGIFLLYRITGTTNLSEMTLPAGTDPALVTWAALLILGGACAKSAQIPLHVWLPDAMAGPTPVSALIHAATMVTAGVYLVARLFWLYGASPLAASVLLDVSLGTFLLGTLLACVQRDIKRVLAWSTVANLGLMFFALASGGREGGLLHLFGHASFKALLFLAAGSVIHFAHHEQDLGKLSGILRSLPVTRAAFWIGVIGAAGCLPFLSSGFFAKEAAIEAGRGAGTLYYIAYGAELLSLFYLFRLLGILDGAPDENTVKGAHENGVSIRFVLAALIVTALVFGFASAPAGPLAGAFSGLLTGVAAHPAELHWAHIGTSAATASVLGLIVYFLFQSAGLRRSMWSVNNALVFSKGPFARAFYFDDFNRTVVKSAFEGAGEASIRGLERPLFAGVLRASGWLGEFLGRVLRPFAAGYVEAYALLMFVFVLGLILFVVAW